MRVAIAHFRILSRSWVHRDAKAQRFQLTGNVLHLDHTQAWQASLLRNPKASVHLGPPGARDRSFHQLKLELPTCIQKLVVRKGLFYCNRLVSLHCSCLGGLPGMQPAILDQMTRISDMIPGLSALHEYHPGGT